MRAAGVLLLLGLLAGTARAQTADTLAVPQALDARAQALLDSLERARPRRPDLGRLLVQGYTRHNREKQRFFTLGPLLDHLVQVNTVEGWVIGQHADFNQALREGRRFISLGADVRYGFASRKPYAQGRLTYWFDRARNRHVHVEGGQYIRQFNLDEPVTALQNTSATLFGGRNPLKIYELTYSALRYRQPLGTRWALVPYLEAATRTPLLNTTVITLRRPERRTLTSNNPLDPERNTPAFRQHDAFLGELALVYESLPGPTVTLGYRRTLGGDGVDARFQKLWAHLRYQVYREPIGQFRLEASAGTFLDRRRVYFPDFWHFSGNELVSVRARLPQFFLLPYYSHSNDRHFAQVFAEHRFNGYFFKRSGLLRVLGWQEVLGLRALYTPERGGYAELNVGVENIFNVLRVDAITAFGDPYGAKFALRYAVGL
jgi:hypothetical protein